MGKIKEKKKKPPQIAPQPGTGHGAVWATVPRDGQDDAEWSNLMPDPALSPRLHQMGHCFGAKCLILGPEQLV